MRLGDYKVPGSELNVHLGFKINAKDLGGNTSASDTANAGIKPSRFRVSVVIKFSNSDDLFRLSEKAKAVDDNGDFAVYEIVDKTAQAMQVKRVKFTDNFDTREIPGKQAWRVSFVLMEYKTVPEKAEKRQELSAAESQGVEGAEQINESEPASIEEEKLVGFEALFKSIDNALAPKADNETT
ncbi:MAG: hypothetical protein K6L75_02560 [Cellvibrionaceae bacterium]